MMVVVLGSCMQRCINSFLEKNVCLAYMYSARGRQRGKRDDDTRHIVKHSITTTCMGLQRRGTYELSRKV